MDELGTVSLSRNELKVGMSLDATLSDPDGDVTGESWTWERSPNSATWTPISSATSNRYLTVEQDTDHYIRAVVSYSDGHGPGKTAHKETSERVRTQTRPPVVAPQPTPPPCPRRPPRLVRHPQRRRLPLLHP